MKRARVLLTILACLVTAFFVTGCNRSAYDGTYTEYYINGEVFVQYYAMTLKGNKYQLDEVKISFGEKTTKRISSGTFSVSDDGAITFTDSNSVTFSGTIDDTNLDFTRSGIIYSMTK